MLNEVKFRFLSLPKSATEGLEHEPKKSDFNIIKELGMGSFGTVYLVSHKKTKAQYALKAINKTLKENLEEKANFNREVEIMYKLNHPNIVKLHNFFTQFTLLIKKANYPLDLLCSHSKRPYFPLILFSYNSTLFQT